MPRFPAVSSREIVRVLGKLGFELAWEREGRWLCLEVLDHGPGLPSSGNLFVPFFTTKPDGGGIGLVLSRQIAEAHGGTLHLENREGQGAKALLRLPLPQPST